MPRQSALSPLAQRQLVDELMRGDLVAFVRRCFETVAPGETLRMNWHIRAMAHALEDPVPMNLAADWTLFVASHGFQISV